MRLNGLYPLRQNDPAYDPAGRDAFVVHSREIWSRGAALIQTAIQDETALRLAMLERLLRSASNFEV